VSDRFYVIRLPIVGKLRSSTDYYTPFDTSFGKAVHCPSCGQALSMLEWLPPFKAELKCWGRQHADIAFGVQDILVSEALADAFRAEKLSGLEILDSVSIVKVVPKKMAGSAPKYFVGRIGWAEKAALDDKASGADYEGPWDCPECRVGYNLLRFKRIALEPNTWLGEDIFYPRRLGPAHPLVSERFKEFFERRQFRGVLFIPAEEFSVDYDPEEVE